MWFPYTNQDLPLQEQQRLAALRARLEPLAEMMQVKGDSECRNGIASVLGAADELCDFEKLRPPSEVIPDCGEEFGSGGMMLKGCVSRYSFVRYALTAGLSEEQALGANPFKFGIIAATDTHIGAPAGFKKRVTRARMAMIEAYRIDSSVRSRSRATSPRALPCVTTRAVSLASMPLKTAAMRCSLRCSVKKRLAPVARASPRAFLPDGISMPASVRSDNYLAEAYREGVPMGADIGPDPSGSRVQPSVYCQRQSRPA